MTTSVPSYTRQINWRAYFMAMDILGSLPSDLAKDALPFLVFCEHGLDIGSGNGRDSSYFLSEHPRLRIDTLDACPEAEKYTDQLKERFGPRIAHHARRFDEFDFGQDRYDFIHANCSLPFHGPHGFRELIERLKKGLRDSGVASLIFYGQGEVSAFCDPGDMARVTRPEIEEMFQGFRIHKLKEYPEAGPSEYISSQKRRRHYFQLIASKPDDGL